MNLNDALALSLIIIAILANAYDFFRNPQKRNEEIYNRTAKDTDFNRLPKRKR